MILLRSSSAATSTFSTSGSSTSGRSPASQRNSSTIRRRSSALSSNMTHNSLVSLSSLCDKPGLAFYTAYAHVKDVESHLSSITDAEQSSSAVLIGESNHKENNNPYALPTLLSCTLSSQELLLGLLYRCNVVDFRPGVDKIGIGLLVNEIVGSFTSLLRVAAGLSGDVPSLSNVGKGENQTPPSKSSSSAMTSSFLPRLADAASLGLLSSSSKSALRSVLALFDDCSGNIRKDTDDISKSMSLLLSVLETTPSSGLTYHQSACTISQILLQSHEGGDGSVYPSPHGPEDYTFQIPHVILEQFFWYIENVLFSQICMKESGGGNSEVLILVGTLLDVCTKVIGILDLMLLADFHPLRVSLHGSSGFYSQAFHRIRSWFSRAYRATSSNMNLDQIHLCPELFVEETVYLQRLDRASASFRTLSFRHYALAQRTIGSNSMGSAGKSFEQMQASFLPHPNQVSNTAKYRTHEYTNVKYGKFVGLGTQAVVDDAKASAGYAFDLDYNDDENSHPASKELLAALERSFVETDVQAFVNLFDTSSNCRVEHPSGTLAYLGTRVSAYFMNMKKRHPVIRSFKCASSNRGGDKITIEVDADFFEGTAVQYQIQGECVADESGSQILRLILQDRPDMCRELCPKDQRLFAWTGATHENVHSESSSVACEILQETFRREMAPAEILAYELNKNKSGKNVSDGLTIVARSMVGGVLPNETVVQDALDQIARCHILLTARTEVTPEGHFFVTNKVCRSINLQIIDRASCRLDCDQYLNTQFNCDKGDMIRVIISKLGSSAEPSFELVSVMFHGICDAISVQDLHSQIIHRLALLATNANHPGRLSVLEESHLPRTIVPPAIHRARRVLAQRTSPAAEPLPLPEPAPIYVPVVQDAEEIAYKKEQSPSSVSVTRKLSVVDTKALLAACKRNCTTVHAAIGAACILSADCGESTKRVLTSAVDLRRRLDIPNSELVYSVGGFDGSAAFEYDMNDFSGKKLDNLWKLCHLIRNDLVDTIDSGRLLTSYLSSVEGLVEAYKGGFLDGGTFGTVFLSNIGNETYEKKIGPFDWTEFNYLYGQFLPGGSHYHITCSTFDDCLTLNFLYVSPTIPESTATAFVESTMTMLRGMTRECDKEKEMCRNN